MTRCRLDFGQFGNPVTYRLFQLLDRIGRARARPADFRIELDDLYRLEAHWGLTFARLGTIHLPPAALRHLGTCLDLRSYWEVVRRSRRVADASTIRIVEEASGEAPAGRSIRVGDDYYGRHDAGDVAFYPYPMHPWVYKLGWHRRVEALRRTPRRFRLFFAGVVNEGYAERFDFPMMTRPAVLDCLLASFRADACVVASRSDLARLRRTDRPIVLILFRGDVTPMASNHFLTRAGYFRMLARSAFALCPPGVFMPHSHNMVEAMAVGTVPVLNYPAFCRPELTAGATCLGFSTPDDLRAAVRQTLEASAGQIEAMKAQVARYYDDELSPDGTARKLARFLTQAGPEARLIVNREFPTARLWSAAQGRVP